MDPFYEDYVPTTNNKDVIDIECEIRLKYIEMVIQIYVVLLQ